jgi:phage baseplate assembly protein gpV
MCRVEIPGLTDGGDVLPLAEIAYPLGDKSRNGDFATEIEMLPGDTVWIEFVGGDTRYPLITHYRNPQVNNSVDWRRYHHRNLELLADQLMNFIAGSDLLVKSGTHVTVQAPRVTIDSPQTDVTGKLTVQGLLTYAGGMSGSGGSGSAATITGNVTVDGSISATGTVMDGGGNSNHHSH